MICKILDNAQFNQFIESDQTWHWSEFSLTSTIRRSDEFSKAKFLLVNVENLKKCDFYSKFQLQGENLLIFITVRPPRDKFNFLGLSINHICQEVGIHVVALCTLRVLALLPSLTALRPYGLVVSTFSPLAFGLGFDPWLCRFTPHSLRAIAAVADSSHTCHANSRSHSAYLIEIGTQAAPFATHSVSETSAIALSPCEAEYPALGRCAQQVLYSRQFAADIGFPRINPPSS